MNSISWVGGNLAGMDLSADAHRIRAVHRDFGGDSWALFGRQLNTAMEAYNDIPTLTICSAASVTGLWLSYTLRKSSRSFWKNIWMSSGRDALHQSSHDLCTKWDIGFTRNKLESKQHHLLA